MITSELSQNPAAADSLANSVSTAPCPSFQERLGQKACGRVSGVSPDGWKLGPRNLNTELLTW